MLRIDGYEAEASIPYAALQRMGLLLGEHVSALSPLHQQALRVAWGTADGPPPDRFLVGMATLLLLAEAGSHHPVICAVDDAHWLDSESLAVFAFVARRLQAESTSLILASRPTDDHDVTFAGIDRIPLAGLDKSSAVALLRHTAPEIVDPVVATHIVDATGGNPLALIDLAHELDVRRHADPSVLDVIPVGRRLETHYLRLIRATAPDVQRWLALAAAAGGDVRLITLGAADQQLPADCPSEASQAGLVSCGRSVEFRHPLVRSVVYSAMQPGDRRRIHGALARAAGALGLVDLEVTHSAAATVGWDDDVAAALEASAERARRRGGRLSAARLLARAAELTQAHAARNGRLLAAAEAAGDAGAAQLALQYLDGVDLDHLDTVQQGRLTAVRASLALFVADPVMVRSAAEMVKAADCFADHEPDSEQRALFAAFEMMLVSEGLTEGLTIDELGHRLDSATGSENPSVVRKGLAALALLPFEQAVPPMRAALNALFDFDEDELIDCGFIGIVFSTALFDVEASQRFLSKLTIAARDRGALRVLDSVLWVRSLFELDRGNPAAAGAFVEQVRELRRASGYDAENVINVAYLVWTDLETDQAEALADIIGSAGFGGVRTAAHVALATREIAAGRYEDAYNRLTPLVEQRFLQVADHMMADYVEAALRSGERTAACEAAERIALIAASAGSPWIRGLDHRSRALLAGGADAEVHFQEAISALRAVDVPCDLGRAHLLYGEWLRRRKRRRDARQHLRAAVELFEGVGATDFCNRATDELAATGEKLTSRAVVAGVEMSPREATVARMAADGSTNAEIAAMLFISSNTVDYHLRKVFSKLNVSSRRQLAERFGSPR